MKIYFISDTHGHHEEIIVPKETNLIICCGDEANHSNPHINEGESHKFFEWFSTLDVEHKVFVPGNHSTAIQEGLITSEDYPGVTFLIHQFINIEGINIFGSPYTPSFGKSWAYMKKSNRMQQVWESVPLCDILVTHGPPKGILDVCEDKDKSNRFVHVGCKSLLNKVQQLRPTIHAFGHIHDEPGCYNYGMLQRDGMTFINASSYVNGGIRKDGFVKCNQGIVYDQGFPHLIH
jgi:Icc-related predicted phosphoesterase